jgi:hypothetical protein
LKRGLPHRHKTTISLRGILATLFNVAVHRPDITAQILEVLHALDWNTIHGNCARAANEITTYCVLGFGHIDDLNLYGGSINIFRRVVRLFRGDVRAPELLNMCEISSLSAVEDSRKRSVGL